nr:hypothetical protein [Tanacetum cinerariifolium]
MERSETREYPSLIQTYFDTHIVDCVFLRDEERLLYEEMLRLNDLGPNTPTGVPYTDDEIIAMIRQGKQRGAFSRGKEPRNESPLSLPRHPDDMLPVIVYPDGISPGKRVSCHRGKRRMPNTPTGVPFTDDEIMAMVRQGKQRGHILGVGSVLARQGRDILTILEPRCTHIVDVDELLTRLQSQHEVGSGSGSGGGEDDEPCKVEDAGEDEDADGDEDSQDILYMAKMTSCRGVDRFGYRVFRLFRSVDHSVKTKCGVAVDSLESPKQTHARETAKLDVLTDTIAESLAGIHEKERHVAKIDLND